MQGLFLAMLLELKQVKESSGIASIKDEVSLLGRWWIPKGNNSGRTYCQKAGSSFWMTLDFSGRICSACRLIRKKGKLSACRNDPSGRSTCCAVKNAELQDEVPAQE